jgi:hypothetical protein
MIFLSYRLPVDLSGKNDRTTRCAEAIRQARVVQGRTKNITVKNSDVANRTEHWRNAYHWRNIVAVASTAKRAETDDFHGIPEKGWTWLYDSRSRLYLRPWLLRVSDAR